MKKSALHQFYEDLSGVAIILALIMLLVMSVLATTISFNSNIDFQAMQNFKKGQESFLAAERCLEEGKRIFELNELAALHIRRQAGLQPTIKLKIGRDGVDCDANPDSCSYCRVGPRIWDAPTQGDAEIVQIPDTTKTAGRPLKDTMLPSGGGSSSLELVTSSFIVTGKDRDDKDKEDQDLNINTGTEVLMGIDIVTLGGGSNIHGGG